MKLDLQFFAQEKTEKATPQKRKESRKKGRVAKSMEVPTAFLLLFAFLTFYMAGDWMLSQLFALLREDFSKQLTIEITEQSIPGLLKQMALQALKIVSPLLLVTMIAGIFGNYIQTGFIFSTEPIMMKLENISPLKGLQRMFSMRVLVDLVKSVLKIVLISSVAFFVLWSKKEEIMLLSQKSIGEGFRLIANLTFQVGMMVSIVLLFLALLDYIYQKYDFEKNIRMSKQEVKEEHKKTEGDPLIRSRIRTRQREMSMNRMIREIPAADVLITNPTHFAVALKYDASTMEAPKVIALGADHLALKMKKIAAEHHIATVENKPLARALYYQTEVGDTIPEHLFKAVAEVLAYVYSLKGRAV